VARRITFRIDAQLAGRLSAAAAQRGMTRSDLVREALQRHLERPRLTATTFLEQAADLVGSVAGPGDLSTNPGRLRHFGADSKKPRLVEFLRSSPLVGASLVIRDRSRALRRRPKRR